MKGPNVVASAWAWPLTTHSLQAQLLCWLLATLLGVLCFNVYLSFNHAQRTANLVIDNTLLGSARMIAEAVWVDENGNVGVEIPPAALEILEAREYMWSNKVVAGMIAIGMLGLAIDVGVNRVNNHLLRWHRGIGSCAVVGGGPGTGHPQIDAGPVSRPAAAPENPVRTFGRRLWSFLRLHRSVRWTLTRCLAPSQTRSSH